MRIKRGIAAIALVAGVTATGIGADTASASSACTAENFTSGGVFDQDGYLACLAGTGGGLPATGGGSLQTLGLAAGLLLVGGALVVSAQRRNDAQPDATPA